MKTLREIRAETVAEHLDLRVIGAKRATEHDEWEATIEELFRAVQDRDGAFSVAESMTVGELLDLHPGWLWELW